MSARIRSLLIGIALACSPLALTGCETVGTTLTSVRDSITSIEFPSLSSSQTPDAAADDTPLIASRPVDCPRVGVVDDLNSITQLIGDSIMGAPISSARLVNIHSACSVQENNVIIDMDIALHSQLGLKGRLREGDKPSFSYPYFVAITTPAGDIVAKEVFSATVAYDASATEIDHAEQLRQVIPLTGAYNARDFEILVGFQLSPVELDYNRRKAAEGHAPAATTIQTLSAAELAAATLKAQEEARAAREAQRAFEESEIARLRALKEAREKEEAEKLAQEQAALEQAAQKQSEETQIEKEPAEIEPTSDLEIITTTPTETTENVPLPDVTAPLPSPQGSNNINNIYDPIPTQPAEPIITAVEPLYPVTPGNAPPPPRIIPRPE